MTSPTTPPIKIPQLTRLKADAALARERLTSVDPAQFATVADLAEWVKAELAYNLVPFFEGMVDAVQEDVVAEVNDLGQQVDQLLDDAGEMLSEASAALLLDAFEAARAVSNQLDKITAHADAMTKKRAKDAIRAFRQKETAARDLIESLVMPEDEDEDEDVPASESDAEIPAEDAAVDEQLDEPATEVQEG